MCRWIHIFDHAGIWRCSRMLTCPVTFTSATPMTWPCPFSARCGPARAPPPLHVACSSGMITCWVDLRELFTPSGYCTSSTALLGSTVSLHVLYCVHLNYLNSLSYHHWYALTFEMQDLCQWFKWGNSASPLLSLKLIDNGFTFTLVRPTSIQRC